MAPHGLPRVGESCTCNSPATEATAWGPCPCRPATQPVLSLAAPCRPPKTPRTSEQPELLGGREPCPHS